MLLHLLVHTELNICHFLLRMSANFKTVWWFFTSLGKPKFDIISFLPEHFNWGLMPYLCTVRTYLLPYNLIWIRTFSFIKGQNVSIIWWGISCAMRNMPVYFPYLLNQSKSKSTSAASYTCGCIYVQSLVRFVCKLW